MLTTIILTLLCIAVTISFICVIIMNIIVGCYMEQNKEYEAEVQRLKAALENAATELGVDWENIANAHSIQANDNATQIVNIQIIITISIVIIIVIIK